MHEVCHAGNHPGHYTAGKLPAVEYPVSSIILSLQCTTESAV